MSKFLLILVFVFLLWLYFFVKFIFHGTISRFNEGPVVDRESL